MAYKTKTGYIVIYRDSKHVYEHRYMAKQAGWDIEGKVVHHKNEIRDDNRLENFELKTQSKHMSDHLIGHTYSVGSNNPNYGNVGELSPCYGRIGDKHPMFGKQHTEEAKRKMKEVLVKRRKDEISNRDKG